MIITRAATTEQVSKIHNYQITTDEKSMLLPHHWRSSPASTSVPSPHPPRSRRKTIALYSLEDWIVFVKSFNELAMMIPGFLCGLFVVFAGSISDTILYHYLTNNLRYLIWQIWTAWIQINEEKLSWIVRSQVVPLYNNEMKYCLFNVNIQLLLSKASLVFKPLNNNSHLHYNYMSTNNSCCMTTTDRPLVFMQWLSVSLVT